MVLEPNIIENNTCLFDGKYEIKNLQLSIDEYKFISQFNVVLMYQDSVDIILGSTWVDTLMRIKVKEVKHESSSPVVRP
jgi:hypothetical protein